MTGMIAGFWGVWSFPLQDFSKKLFNKKWRYLVVPAYSGSILLLIKSGWVCFNKSYIAIQGIYWACLSVTWDVCSIPPPPPKKSAWSQVRLGLSSRTKLPTAHATVFSRVHLWVLQGKYPFFCEILYYFF